MENFQDLLDRIRDTETLERDWSEARDIIVGTCQAMNRYDAATMAQTVGGWSNLGCLHECLRGTGLEFTCWSEDGATVVELLSPKADGDMEVKGRGANKELYLALCEALLSAVVEGNAVDITDLPTRRDLDPPEVKAAPEPSLEDLLA